MEEYREQYRLLGLRIAYYRKKRGWTQEEFSDKVGCSIGFLSRIEANNGKHIGRDLPFHALSHGPGAGDPGIQAV